MKRCIVPLLLVLTLVVKPLSQISAQPTNDNRATTTSDVLAYQSNYGITGQNIAQATAGIIWPRTSSDQYVFGGGLWLGGKVMHENEERTLVVVSYNPLSGRSWFKPESELVRTTLGSTEILSSTFSDTVLNLYEGATAAFQADGYPLGVVVTQSLRGWSAGVLQDVVTLTSTVHNNHNNRSIRDFVMSYVMDIDIGKLQNSIQAGAGDKCALLNDQLNLSIFKAWSNPEQNGTSNGVMGIAIVNGPVEGDINSGVSISLLAVPLTAAQRYGLMTTGMLEGSTTGSDIVSIFSTAPVELQPGDSVSSTLVLMFGATNDAANDQRMMAIVESLQTSTGVADDVRSTQLLKVFPNPVVNSQYINVVAEQMPSRIDIYNALGALVLSVGQSTNTIDVSELPSGNYTMVARTERTIQSQSLTILR